MSQVSNRITTFVTYAGVKAKWNRRRLFFAALATLFVAERSYAQYTWLGVPATANWNNASNWVGGLPVSGFNTTLTFGGSNLTTLNDNLAAGFQLNKLSFTAFAPAYTISGNSLDFRTNGSSVPPTIVMDSPNAVTINNHLTLAINFAVTGSGTGILTLNGVISGVGFFNKLSTGTLALTGTSNLGHYVLIDAGTLDITGGGTVSNTVGNIGYYNAGSTGTVTVGGGTGTSNWTNTGGLRVGHTGTGTLNITGGGTVSNTEGVIGWNAGSTGTVTVGGGTGTSNFTNSGNLFVGNAGAGTLNITGGGIVSSTIGLIGTDSVGTGTVTVGGGTGTSTWTNSSFLYVGYSSIGTLDITDGGTVSNTDGYIGRNAGSTGTVNVGGGTGTSTWTNGLALVVGYDGSGTLNIVGGGTVSNLDGVIGNNAGSTGTVTVGVGTGTSTLTNSSDLYVGYSGTGTLNITGGGTVSNTFGTIGRDALSIGTVTVGGGTGTSTWTNTGGLTVGDSGAGTLNIIGGGTVSNTDGYIGFNAGSTGTVTVGGGIGTSSWINNGQLFVGYDSTGTLDITGGGMVSNTFGTIGRDALSIGTVTVGGGTGTSTWTNAGGITVGDSGTGTLNINTGGTVIATSLDGGNGTSDVKFNGGTLRITAPDSASNTLILLTGGGTIDVQTASNTFTITSAISGSGDLTKSGTGTLTLTGTNIYAGGTTINRGTLQISSDDNLGSHNGQVTINPLGTLLVASSMTTSRLINLFSGQLSVATGQTLTFNNAAVGGGFLNGTFATQAGSSNLLTGNTLRTSATLTLNGTDLVQNGMNNGQMTVTPSTTGNTATFNGLSNGSGGRITLPTGAGTATALVNVSDFVSNGLVTIADGPNTTNYNLVTNTGTTELNFGGGSRTFIGSIPSGTSGNYKAYVDLNGKNAVVAGGLFVNNGGVYDGTAGSAHVIADYGALVKGAGYWSTAPSTRNGGVFQTGNSPGKSIAGTATISGPAGEGTSNMNFQINNATGVAGPTPDGNNQVSGWSLLQVQRKTDGPLPLQSSGNLTWSATTADKLTINMQTLINPTTVGNDVPGLMDNFNPSQSYAWLFITQVNATNPGGPLGTYTGPIDDATLTASVNFVLSSSIPFANSLNGGMFGIHYVDNSSQAIAERDFYVTFTPTAVPEPANIFMITLSALATGGYVFYQRNRQRVKMQEIIH